MKVICPKCKSDSVGTVERLMGVALVIGVNEAGEFETAGETEINWDDQVTEKDANGNARMACTACGHEWAWDPDENEKLAA